MTLFASQNGLNQQEWTQAVARRSERVAMILTLSMLGVCCVYCGALYLIVR
jgi:hypothetical protein